MFLYGEEIPPAKNALTAEKRKKRAYFASTPMTNAKIISITMARDTASIAQSFFRTCLIFFTGLFLFHFSINDYNIIPSSRGLQRLRGLFRTRCYKTPVLRE